MTETAAAGEQQTHKQRSGTPLPVCWVDEKCLRQLGQLIASIYAILYSYENIIWPLQKS